MPRPEALPAEVVSTATSPAFDDGAAPGVSVVVSTRGRAAYLPELCDALESQDLGLGRFEVVVVDDGSTDDTWAVLGSVAARTPLRLRVLRLRASVGQGPGRNVGTRACRGALVAYTDDDCLPAPGWLSTLVAPFGSTDGPAHVVVQGRTVPWTGDRDLGGPWARTVWVLRPTWLFEACNIAYRRADVVAAGGFPVRGQVPSAAGGKLVGEDALLGWRVVDRGARPVFAADAQVFHRNLPATYLQWLAGHRGRAVFPDLVGRHRYGRRVLWARWFLAPRTAAFDLAAVSGALWLGTHRARWLLGLVPWVWTALPEAHQRGGRHPAVRLAQIAAGDLVGLGALLAGSARHRCAVL